MKIISVKHLTKRYGDLLAVDDISFDVDSGSIFGLIGPNGAGKSTIINVLSGQLYPTGGSAEVDGYDVSKQRLQLKRIMGLLPEDVNLPSFLTTREYLEFVAGTYGMKNAAEKVDEHLKFFGVDHRQDVLCKDLSRGEKERLMLAAAFIHEPKVVFIDEPFHGIDPLSQLKLRKFLRGYLKKGTIILCTHVLSLAKDICDEVAIIDKGKIVAVEKTKKIKDLEKFFLSKVK